MSDKIPVGFECPICLEPADPYLTACGHNLCKECLAILTKDKLASAKCPECRKPLVYNENPLKNFGMIRALEDLNKAQKSSPRIEESLYSTNEHWENMISHNFLENIYLNDWRYPTKVQAEVIPLIQSGKNLLIESWNGTGKTGSFVIGTLSRVIAENQTLQVISLSHTKEIKDMHYDVYSKICKNTEIIVQKTVKYSPNVEFGHVLCGTVASVANYLKRITSKNQGMQWENMIIVIDECDEILANEENSNMLHYMLGYFTNPQILLYSATLSEKTRKFAEPIQNFEEIIITSPVSINPKIKVLNINSNSFSSKARLVHELLRRIPFNMCNG